MDCCECVCMRMGIFHFVDCLRLFIFVVANCSHLRKNQTRFEQRTNQKKMSPYIMFFVCVCVSGQRNGNGFATKLRVPSESLEHSPMVLRQCWYRLTLSLSLFLFWVLQLECELLCVLFLLFIHPTSTCSIKCRLKRSKTINLVAQCESFNYFPLETIAIIHFQMSLWYFYFRIWNWTVFCDSFALFIPCPLFHFLFTFYVTNLWTSWEIFYDER